MRIGKMIKSWIVVDGEDDEERMEKIRDKIESRGWIELRM